MEGNESELLDYADGNLQKKLKNNSGDAVSADENAVMKLSEDLSAIESYMKFLEVPDLADASFDGFFAQDGSDAGNLWGFDEMAMIGSF